MIACVLGALLGHCFPSFFPLTVGQQLSYVLVLLLSGLGLAITSNLAYTIIAVLLHPGLFMLLSVYVLRRVSRRIRLSSARAFLPSQVIVLHLTMLSIWYWLSSWHNGLYGGGDSYDLIRLGILNTAVLFLLFLAPRAVVQYLSSHERPSSETLTLAYNFCIYIAFLLVLFPWMGEAFL